VTVELLRQNDDPVSVERPARFDEGALRSKVDFLIGSLRDRFGAVTAEVGPPFIQDASFFAALKIEPEATRSGHGLWVRISNFGDMASAGVALPGAYDGEDLGQVTDESEWHDLLAAIESHGFRYIAEDDLWPDYDGQNEHLKAFYRKTGGRLTWWIRFFDWI
jgi:hypothetical protein